MADLVAAGTGAERATVWLRVGGELHAQASSNGRPRSTCSGLSGDGPPPMPPGRPRCRSSTRASSSGSISMRMPPKEKLTPAQERLVVDVASQAGLVLSNAQLIEELRASRLRLVAAQDAERRKIERNLHDGAQQQLVALAVKLRLAAGSLERDPAKAAAMLADLQEETADAIENLRDLARGIYPPLLADQGLPAALTGQARKVPIPVTVDRRRRRPLPPAGRGGGVLLLPRGAAEHHQVRPGASVEIRLEARDGELASSGGRRRRGLRPRHTRRGSGLQNMADRMAVLGGTWRSARGRARAPRSLGWVPADPAAVDV